jgi:hypothetical protein
MPRPGMVDQSLSERLDFLRRDFVLVLTSELSNNSVFSVKSLVKEVIGRNGFLQFCKNLLTALREQIVNVVGCIARTCGAPPFPPSPARDSLF